MAKVGRKAVTTMKPEMGESRKSKICSLVAAGLPNPAIWAAMEMQYPQTIQDDIRRAEACAELGIEVMPYDAGEREKLGWAIRQVKGLMLKEDEEIDDIANELGAGEAKNADDIIFRNRPRFSCGMPVLDWIYGTTYYKWTEDAPNSKYKTEVDEIADESGKIIKREKKIWVSGDYQAGNLMPVKPGPGNWVAKSTETCKQETGLPEAFLALWGGAKGVGKSTTAVELIKSCNKMGHLGLYFNGEEEEVDFRMKIGANVDGDRFKVVSGTIVRMDSAVQQIYKYRPKVVIFDSWQMIAEVQKGFQGTKRALSTFINVKADEEAGRPHIIFISQLNSKGKVAGHQYFQHMVDMVATLTKVAGRTSVFQFACEEKNRGGETGRRRMARHLAAGGMEWLDKDFGSGPIYQQMVEGGEIIKGV